MENGLMDGKKEQTVSPMEKIKYIILIAIIFSLSGCSNSQPAKISKQNLTPDSVIESTNLTGKWVYVTNFNDLDFRLELIQEDNVLKGSHCFIKGELGDQIDCPEEDTFSGKLADDIITGSFKSDWSDSKIDIKGVLQGDTLIIKTLSGSNAAFFLPEMKFVKTKSK